MKTFTKEQKLEMVMLLLTPIQAEWLSYLSLYKLITNSQSLDESLAATKPATATAEDQQKIEIAFLLIMILSSTHKQLETLQHAG